MHQLIDAHPQPPAAQSGTVVKQLVLPIFEARYFLVIADDIYAEREGERWVELFGPNCMGPGIDACVYRHDFKGRFAVFFRRGDVDSSTMTHEVFHLTHRILDWAGTNFDAHHHEHAALLNGYLNDQTMTFLLRNGINVRYGGEPKMLPGFD